MEKQWPKFEMTSGQRGWIEDERRTSRLIRYVWQNASPVEWKNARFLRLIVSLAWITKNRYGEATPTPKWRNSQFADYLGVGTVECDALAKAAAERWPKSNAANWRKQLALTNHTGITHYYKALRPAALRHVEKHAETVSLAMSLAFQNGDAAHRIAKAMDALEPIAKFKTMGKTCSFIKAISPALACLDARSFPIMNDPTAALLKAVGRTNDRDGALALSKFIEQHGFKDNFELDVYANEYKSKFPKNRKVGQKLKKMKKRLLGFKNEQSSIKSLSKGVAKIRKLHNKLTNKFKREVEWTYPELSEGEYDLLIPNWKGKRHLLIEAKTASKGPGGRFQVRTAIGQLFDYRRRIDGVVPKAVDLAVLLPTMPSEEIIGLLDSVQIETLWFEGKKLEGTVKL